MAQAEARQEMAGLEATVQQQYPLTTRKASLTETPRQEEVREAERREAFTFSGKRAYQRSIDRFRLKADCKIPKVGYFI